MKTTRRVVAGPATIGGQEIGRKEFALVCRSYGIDSVNWVSDSAGAVESQIEKMAAKDAADEEERRAALGRPHTLAAECAASAPPRDKDDIALTGRIGMYYD
jgi:hypothetical protein